MFENEFYIPQLLSAYFNGKLNADQKAELTTWLNSSAGNQKYFDQLLNEHDVSIKLAQFEAIDTIAGWNKTMLRLKTQKEEIKPFIHKKLWPRISIAAASVIFLVAALAVLHASRDNRFSNSGISNHLNLNDVPAGKNTATLTLGNGRKIRLSDAENGHLAKESGINITKTADGKLVYEVASEAVQPSSEGRGSYNTLSTSNSEQYLVILPDQTRVWLNAASSITYPSSFAGLKKRKVQITGEVYLEVAKRKHIPFLVVTKNQTLEVLGTHFNINAYANESSIKTTLLEGSVRITASSLHQRGAAVTLQPGQQSDLQGQNIQVNKADIEEVIAWKNGYFKFNEDLESIMNKISRWYNVTVIYKYQPDPNLKFGGKILRSKNLSAVLNIIELTGNVHFKIEGRKVTVMK